VVPVCSQRQMREHEERGVVLTLCQEQEFFWVCPTFYTYGALH